jgi:hypothetical protein
LLLDSLYRGLQGLELGTAVGVPEEDAVLGDLATAGDGGQAQERYEE